MNNILYQDNQWKILKEEATLPDGRKTTWVRIHRCEAVHVLAFKEPKPFSFYVNIDRSGLSGAG